MLSILLWSGEPIAAWRAQYNQGTPESCQERSAPRRLNLVPLRKKKKVPGPDRFEQNIPLGKESRYIQLRLEAFNVFNHPNFQDKNFGANVTGPWNYASPTDPLTITKNDNWGTF